ncbi:MAG TPA: hypothetical protein VFE25_03500 [Opitutaceae bacterium]|nr:hypothetical protein [Opitutaceae bacterium]
MNGGDRRRDSWILAAMGLAALAPYAIYHRLFQQLFWFGDEFDLIDQIDRLGFWKWVWLAFAENFVPLFKVLWGGAALASGGSYACMLALAWITHALNVALLGRLMRTCGLSWLAVIPALLIFGLSVENYETLSWSVQWSAILSVTFMLLGLDRVFRGGSIAAPVGYAAASALSFSRGVLTGAVLGVTAFLGDGEAPLPRRVTRSCVFLVPAIVVASLIFLLAKGNQHSMNGHFGHAATFAAWYFCVNPMHSLLLVESWGWRTTVLLGAVKVFVYVSGLIRSRGHARRLFVALILFDLANAALLGIGRYHTGLESTVSSRYQYASMLAFLPIAGFWVSSLIRDLEIPRIILRPACTVVLVVLATALCRQWPSELERFSRWRGADSRRVLFTEPNPASGDVPGIPGMPMDRAKELIAKYRLH